MGHYYKPSGKASPAFIVYFLLTAIVVLPLLGLAYAYAIWYIPFIYINAIIAGAVGFIIALVLKLFTIRLGKVRNPGLALGLSILAAVVTLYFHWAVWLDLVLNAGESYGSSRFGFVASNIKILDVFAIAFQPQGMFELMAAVNEVGTWGLASSSSVSGVFLSLIWLVEAAIIIGAAVIFSKGAANAPFCEVSNTWFDEVNMPAMNYVVDCSALISRIEADDTNAFDNVFLARTNEGDHSGFELYVSGLEQNYLTITNKKASRNDKGEVEFEDLEVVEYIGISNLQKERLLERPNATRATPENVGDASTSEPLES